MKHLNVTAPKKKKSKEKTKHFFTTLNINDKLSKFKAELGRFWCSGLDNNNLKKNVESWVLQKDYWVAYSITRILYSNLFEMMQALPF